MPDMGWDESVWGKRKGQVLLAITMKGAEGKGHAYPHLGLRAE